MAQAMPCTKTRAFPSERAALDALADIIRRSMMGIRVRHHHSETGVYECPKCGPGVWHLTSQPVGAIVSRKESVT